MKLPHKILTDAHELGHVELPEEYLTEHAALTRLKEHTLDKPARPLAAQDDAVERMIAAAYRGDPIPSNVGVVEAETRMREYEEAVRALRVARERQAEAVDGWVSGHRDSLITGTLRPVYLDVLDRARQVAPLLAGADTTPIGIARADAKVRNALVEIEQLAARYSTVRSVWSRLFEIPPTTNFAEYLQMHGEVRDPATVWPAYSRAEHQVRAALTPPWQEQDTAAKRLLWLANSGAQVWMPTPAEFDHHIRTVHAEQIQNMQRANWARQAVSAMSA